MQFRQRQEPQSTTRHRCVEERGRRIGRQPEQVAKAANQVSVEALQLLRKQVPEGIFDARV